MVTSRLIIRGLPKNVTEKDLKEHIASIYSQPLTDCRIARKHGKKTPSNEGPSRMFAYVGFRTEADAELAKSLLDKSFLMTRRLAVDFAYPEGSTAIPLPWSKLTKSKKRQAEDKPAASKDPMEWLASKRVRTEGDSKEISAADTGRLRILNIPYDITESELREILDKHGTVVELTCPRSEVDPDFKNKGYCYVTYQFPEHACVAQEALHNTIVQGRTLRVEAAELPIKKTKIEDTEKVTGPKKKSEVKKQLEKIKAQRYSSAESWNLLFVSAHTAMNVLASQLGIEADEMMDLGASDSLAARAAVSEALVLNQTVQWLEEMGLTVADFQSQANNIVSCRIGAGTPRSDRMLIAKHLGPWVTAEELQDKFALFGQLSRFSLAPTKTLALVTYLEASCAANAMKALNMSKIHDRPLYLEWAPLTFMQATPAKPPEEPTEALEEPVEKSDEAEGDQAVISGTCSVFIKNLSFGTTEETLTALFRKCPGFKFVKIMQKSVREKDLETGLTKEKKRSAGYGFAYFETKEQCLDFMKKYMSHVVDGHALQLSSSKSAQSPTSRPSDNKPKKSSKEEATVPISETKKIMVKNLPFEANPKDLRQLFEVFGAVSAVRIPKKRDGTARGFGFVEYLTKKDAAAAFKSLQHTHLLGRHLVLIPVASDST